jgi:hypothetical protein
MSPMDDEYPLFRKDDQGEADDLDLDDDDIEGDEEDLDDYDLGEVVYESVDGEFATGYVYFVYSPLNNLIKIGYSKDYPDRRLNELRAVSPVPLLRFGYLRGSQEDEGIIHEMFDRLRHRREWFRAEASLFIFIVDNADPWEVRKRSAEDKDVIHKAMVESFRKTHDMMVRWIQEFNQRIPFWEFCAREGFVYIFGLYVLCMVPGAFELVTDLD